MIDEASLEDVDETMMTIVTATVPPGSEDEVLATFRLVTRELPPEVLQTFLMRSEANEWSVATVWRSRDDLEQYLRSVETQGAIEMLGAAGGHPSRTTLDILHMSHQKSSVSGVTPLIESTG